MTQNIFHPEQFSGSTDKDRFVNAFKSLGNGTTFQLMPNRKYIIDSLSITSKSNIIIDGQGSEIHLTNNTSALKLIDCNNIIIRNLKVTMDITKRNYASGLWLERVRRFIVEDCIIDGSNATGIVCWDSTIGEIRNNKVKNTLADGIHITRRSKQIRVYGNTVVNTQDDCISVVSYLIDKGYSENINIYDNNVSKSTTRGITTVGGKHINIHSNFISETRRAGIYLSTETDTPGYYDVQYIKVSQNTIEKANTYSNPDLIMASINIRQDNLTNKSKNIEVVGNTIIGGSGEGINASGVNMLSVIGNHFLDISFTGMSFYGLENAIISDNIFNMVSSINYNGIQLLNSKNITLSNNTLNDVGLTGMYIVGNPKNINENIIIEGNNIINPNNTSSLSVDGVIIEYAKNVTVTNNSIQATNSLRSAVILTDTVTGAVVVDNNNYSNSTYTGLPINTVSVQTNKSQINRINHRSSIPATGTWNRGDIIYNYLPSPGGYVGWICTSSGIPGTWKGFGTIQT